jgi:hypothetical protein
MHIQTHTWIQAQGQRHKWTQIIHEQTHTLTQTMGTDSDTHGDRHIVIVTQTHKHAQNTESTDTQRKCRQIKTKYTEAHIPGDSMQKLTKTHTKRYIYGFRHTYQYTHD